MTPYQIREKLTDLAVSLIGQDKREQFLKALIVEENKANYGVSVTDDLKYTGAYVPVAQHLERCLTYFIAVRFSRQNSVHTSPTVLFNGVIAPEISSTWLTQDWVAWLTKKIGKPEAGSSQEAWLQQWMTNMKIQWNS